MKLLFPLIGIFLVAVATAIYFRRQEYNCMSPDEIARCKRYQRILDNTDWSYYP